jgi:hypothetical protein
METYRYAITNSNGDRCRSLGRVNGSIKFVNAKDEGCSGDEMIFEVGLASKIAGNYTFNEDDDISTFNIRLIDNTHPKWDSKFSNYGKTFSYMIKMMEKFLK